MKTFKQNTVIQDARSKIRPKVKDARTKLLSKANTNKFEANTNLKKKTFDARQNIKVKNIKVERLKPPPIVIKKEIKIETEFPANLTGPSTSKTTRTIKNPVVIKQENKDANFANYSFKNAKDWDGFISVSNGTRVLTERVTMDGIGMKIAVRNDNVKKQVSLKKRPTEPLNKKKIVTRPNTNSSIQITTSNPAAIVKLKKKRVEQAKKKRAANLLKASQFNLQKRSQYQPKFTETAQEMPTIKTVHYSPPPLPVITQPPSMMPEFQINKQHTLILGGIRPMISSGSADFRHSISSVSQHNYSPLQQKVAESAIASPLEGTKIYVSNLHPVVVEDDIMELFSVLGPIRRARMVGHGTAEVVYIRQDDAVKAYHKYNNRDLDGQPMHMKLLLQDRVAHNVEYTWMSEIGTRRSTSSEVREIHPATLQRALFKGGSTGASSRPVIFTVKI